MYENKTKSPRVLCIVGPTASGKTALAVAAAKALNGVIHTTIRQVSNAHNNVLFE